MDMEKILDDFKLGEIFEKQQFRDVAGACVDFIWTFSMIFQHTVKIFARK